MIDCEQESRNTFLLLLKTQDWWKKYFAPLCLCQMWNDALVTEIRYFLLFSLTKFGKLESVRTDFEFSHGDGEQKVTIKVTNLVNYEWQFRKERLISCALRTKFKASFLEKTIGGWSRYSEVNIDTNN